MSEETNPYNCSRPGNLFVGHENLRREIVRGLRGGKSFALLGGRRCGKTSLLLKLLEDLQQASFQALPRMVDMQEVVPRSPFDWFRAVYAAAVQDTQAPAWDAPRDSQHYQEFLARLDQARPRIEEAHGPDWLVVLLIDELDSAVAYLPDDTCFQNFRNLLTNSRYKSRFRAVATGVTDMADLIQTGSSPLNNLDPKYLGVLAEPAARELIACGYSSGLPTWILEILFEQTGRHPYLLQGLLEYLWDKRENLDEEAVRSAVHRFVRDRMGTFRQWLKAFKPDGCAVYRELAAEGGVLAVAELRRRLPQAAIDEALSVLDYHGVIDDADPERPRIAGILFRDWFREHHRWETAPAAAAAPSPAAPVQPVPNAKRVFVVHGRNARVRNALFTLLRAFGLEPLEWSDAVEATGNPAPHIFEILEKGFAVAKAAVVLLTPDDEARLRPEFLTANDGEEEKDLTGQPRPNVLFEAGMAIARFPRATVLVQVGRIRPFSDVSGIHVLHMDDSLKSREQLAKRLEMAGCKVDLSDTYWQTAGEFSRA